MRPLQTHSALRGCCNRGLQQRSAFARMRKALPISRAAAYRHEHNRRPAMDRGQWGSGRATDASAEMQRADAALDNLDSEEEVDVPFAVAGNGDMPLYEQRRADASMRTRSESQAAGDACLHGGRADAGSSPGAADRADRCTASADVREVEYRCVLAGECAVPDPWSCLASAMLINLAP